MTELSEMIYDRGLRDWELEPAYNATMEDIDMEKVQAFIARRSSSGRQSGRFKNSRAGIDWYALCCRGEWWDNRSYECRYALLRA